MYLLAWGIELKPVCREEKFAELQGKVSKWTFLLIQGAKLCKN